jgi:hypothetical protein
VRHLLFEQVLVPGPIPLYGLFGVFEAAAWLVLIGSAGRALAHLRLRQLRPSRPALVLALTALAARLFVPAAPYNWYMSVQSLTSLQGVYTRLASYIPLPARVLGFDAGLGFPALLALNLIAGVAAVLVIWRAARHFALSERGAFLLALSVAVVPTYALLSASEAPQITMLLLWGVAALAFAAVRDGRGGRRAHAVLIAATFAAAPIRLESWLVFPSFVLLVGGTPAAWRGLLREWRRYLPLAATLALGTAASLVYRWDLLVGTTGGVGGLGTLLALILLLPPAAIGLMNLGWVSFLPLIVALPAGYELVRGLRRRDWRALATNFVPPLLFGAPVAAGTAFFIADLGTAAYFVLFMLLPLTVCARGIDHLIAKFRAGELLARRGRRIAAGAMVPVAAVFFLVLPYRFGYMFQDEFRFLSAQLPDDSPATLAVIWDPSSEGGDFDCCLAYPHPLIAARWPHLRMEVLRAEDLPRAERGEVAFDYYFSGTLPLLDIDGPECGYLGALASEGDRERWRADRERLVQLRRLDEAMRERYPLAEVARQHVEVDINPPVAPGTNGVNFGFPRDGVTLVLFRHADDTARAAPATP